MMISSIATSIPLLFFCIALLRFGSTSVSSFLVPSTKAFSGIHHHPSSISGRQLEKSSSSLFQSADDNGDLKKYGLNEIQTLLREAVRDEEYMDAASYSSELFERLYGSDAGLSKEEKKAKRKRMSWKGQGVAPWLVDRLDVLDYPLPTTIQINTMESVNQILSDTNDDVEDDDGFISESDDDEPTMEERIKATGKDLGIVVSGSTGSGKSLAFLAPLLSILTDSLFARQRARVGAEESIGDISGDLVNRISVVTSPAIQSDNARPVKPGTIALGAANPNPTLGKSGASAVVDVKTPLALIVVPTRELGIQISTLLYELVGGNKEKKKYKGPKGVRIACVLNDEEAGFGLKLQTDVAVVMPEYIGKLITDGELVPSKLRAIAFDEADLALEMIPPETLTSLFDTKSRKLTSKGDGEDDGDYIPYEDRDLQQRLTFMVGASVTESLGNLVVKSRILPEGKSYIATATRNYLIQGQSTSDEDAKFAAGDESKKASLQDLAVCLDPGLKHQRVVVGDEASGLLVLARLLRKDLEDYDKMNKRQDGPPPRVVIFLPDEETAMKSISTMRDALWGEHRVCVLLPKTGKSPLAQMEDFKNNDTTVMLATPNSVRGLDFPQVTHVYTLYLPTDDPREYVHLAGRVGRVGQTGSVRGTGGQVLSILKSEDADKMDSLAKDLGFEFTDVAPIDVEVPRLATPADDDDDDEDEDEELLDPSDLDKMRKFLEDTVSLASVEVEGEEISDESSAIDTTSVQTDDEEIDDDEELEEYPGFQ